MKRFAQFLVLVTCFVVCCPASAQNLPDAGPTAPPAPDYARPNSWAASSKDEGVAAAVAPGSLARQNLPVDVFYIHPTTDRTAGRWNQPLSDKAVNDWTDGSVIARQASAFNGCCRVFAPRYRQATSASQSRGGQIRDDAFALAYGDVRRAFRYYLDHYNRGRPFIFVGHSQGAAHLERLLDEEIDGKPLSARLVAAYDVGITFPASKYDRPGATLKVCDKPDSTGCVVHWSSVLPEADLNGSVKMVQAYNRTKLPPGADPEVLCINPLTFDRSRPVASGQAAKGAVPGTPDEGAIRRIVPRAVSARCERGFLVVEPSSALGLTPLKGGSMHYHDLGLFYEDVRENAVLRARAWLAAHPARSRH